MTALEHSSSNRVQARVQSGAEPRACARVDREKAREVLREQFSEARPIALGVALDALEACVVQPAPQTIDRDALVELIRDETGWDWPGEEDEPEPIFGCDSRVPSSDRVIGELVDAVLALVRPVEGVLLAPEEARRAAGWWDMADGKYGVTQPDLDLVRKLEASE